jgi:2-deoxy-scyllo-inosamine dehydrogenase (SAM-dependent)
MSDQVLDRVIAELKEIDYSGRVSYHFYNEPLLRKDLERIVAMMAREVPKAKQILFTNGDYLTDRRHASLLEAGVDLFVVTSHSGKVHPPRARQVVQQSEQLELTNRGGILVELPGVREADLVRPCFAPSEMLVITVTGEVVLCYEDALRKHVYGDLTKQSIGEIWNSEELLRLRSLLESGKRAEAATICMSCTNRAHSSQGLSARSEPFWKEVGYEW